MISNYHMPNPFGILAVHASAVCVDGGALIFLGPSESGKSTICRQLSAHTYPLADDAVYLIPSTEGLWKVAQADSHALAGPLSAQEADSLYGIPLRAIFRLYQDPNPCLKRVTDIQTCHHLIDALFELYWPQHYAVDAKKLAFTGLAAIARSVPGYHLYFNLSPRTPTMIKKLIGF